MRDRIVCGVGDESIRQRLLQKDDVSLEKCERICCSMTSTASQAHEMSSGDNVKKNSKECLQ